jgi:ERCC4-type nuclease
MILTPTVLVDSREQRPLRIRAYPGRVAGLPTGDYSILGIEGPECLGFAVERKSLDDLAASLSRGRDRFFREVERLRVYRFSAILIEGWRADIEAHRYRSQMTPAAILETISAIETRTPIKVVFVGDASGAARILESWVKQFAGGIAKEHGRLLAACGKGATE